MAEDWLADVRRFDANADESVVTAIIKYCGIALRTPNAARVTFSDPTETGRVRDNFLKKKLGLTQDDTALDTAIAQVGEAMGGGDQNRVSVYYLLTKHFGMFGTFGGTASSGAGTAAAAATAVAAATGAEDAEAADSAPATAQPATGQDASEAAGPAPAAAAGAAATGAAAATADTTIATAMSPAASPVSRKHSPIRPSGSNGHRAAAGDDGGILGLGCVAGLVALGAIIFAALVSVWAGNTILAPKEAPTPTPTATASPAPEPEPTATPQPEAPEGSGVTAGERDGKPLLTVYFDSGSSVVTPDFETVSAEIRTYLDKNPNAKVNISGYNDPTGNAAINAELSKNRAQNVQAALVALGIAVDRTELVKPDNSTTTDLTPAEARRVEITIVE